MEPAKGCSICIGSLPGSVKTPWFGLMEGSEIPEEKTAEPSTVRDPTSKFNQPQTQEYRVEMYPGVICSAVHAATRCAFAITTLHPGSNLKNLAYEEWKKRGSLHAAWINWQLARDRPGRLGWRRGSLCVLSSALFGRVQVPLALG